MCGVLFARAAFGASLPQPRRVPTPNHLLRYGVSCQLFTAASVPISFTPLTSVAFSGDSRFWLVRPIWTDFLENWMPFSVVFFLWCTLYFSTKQWQQSAHERARLVRAEWE